MADARQRASVPEAIPTLRSISLNAPPELPAGGAAKRAMADASGIRSARRRAAPELAAANASRLAAYLRVIDR
jgi:hypothetical protein